MRFKHIYIPNIFFLCVLLTVQNINFAQSDFVKNSVLKDGKWYKIGIVQKGIYRLNYDWLLKNRIIDKPIPSDNIHIYSFGNNMVAESLTATITDDIQPVSIQIVDGGNRLFEASDYLLFYAQDKWNWRADTLNGLQNPIGNIYSDTVYYFLCIDSSKSASRILVNSFFDNQLPKWNNYIEKTIFKKHNINLLNSGKIWLGVGLGADAINNKLTFNIDTNGAWGQQDSLIFRTNVVSRTIGNTSSLLKCRFSNDVAFTKPLKNVSGNFIDEFAVMQQFDFKALSSSFIELSFSGANDYAQLWLNWCAAFVQKKLQFNQNKPTFFHNQSPYNTSNLAAFNAVIDLKIWDITNPLTPQELTYKIDSGKTIFSTSLHQQDFVAFTKQQALIPTNCIAIANQNLHSIDSVDYVLIAPKQWLPEATELANFHKNYYNRKVAIADVESIANEFSGGIKDPAGIRNFLKMLYQRKSNNLTQPLLVCLLGTGSYDYLRTSSSATNFVPCYETDNSFHPLLSYATDDFFAQLSTSDTGKLQVAIGRIPATSAAEAKSYIQKVINYHHTQGLGKWRSEVCFIADDKDYNTHIADAEYLSTQITQQAPHLHANKVYIDAFKRIDANGITKVPDANNAIIQQFNNGNSIINYTGHGSDVQLADEAILTTANINDIQNSNKLPFLIAATCDFTPIDRWNKKSLASTLLFKENGGVIGLVSTTRTVFANSNKQINAHLLTEIANQHSDRAYNSIGAIAMRAKNISYKEQGDFYNIQKFVLIGDPGIALALPQNNIVLDSIYQENKATIIDTIKTLIPFTMRGRIANQENASIQNDFNGIVTLSFYDSASTYSTLGNTAQNTPFQYTLKDKVLSRITTTVRNGTFSLTGNLPATAINAVNSGFIYAYAYDTIHQKDAATGCRFIVSSKKIQTSKQDTVGPSVKLFLNDTLFKSGSITNSTPLLLAYFLDSSGVDMYSKNALYAILDGDTSQKILLNAHYTSLYGSYQQGYSFTNLTIPAAGTHTIQVYAKDLLGNLTVHQLNFQVNNASAISINNAIVFPNPATDVLELSFEHNQPNQTLNITQELLTSHGVVVSRLNNSIFSTGNVCKGLKWNFRQNNLYPLSKGMYIYRIIVRTNAGTAKMAKIISLY